MGVIQEIVSRILFVTYNFLVLVFIFVGWILVLFLKTKSITLKGYFKRIFQKIRTHKNSFLFHFSSLGEMNAAMPLIKYFKEQNKEIVITTFTETAYYEALKKHDNVYLLPFDFYFLVKRFIAKINPSFVFITETEFWPSFIRIASQKTRVVWINARISDKSFKKYFYLSFFFRFIFEKVQKVFVQTQKDYEKFLSFLSSDKLMISGNTKYDFEIKDFSSNEINPIEEWKKDTFCVVFGSIHSDELEIILKSYAFLKNENLKVKYIIVPRHVEKINDFIEILEKYNVDYFEFSKIDNANLPYGLDILIFDKIGYLMMLYKISDISFVGGTLNKIGGHNLLEPAYFSKPVLFGPNYFSQKMAGDALITNGGGFIVNDEYDLKSRIKFFIFSSEKLLDSGKKAKNTLIQLSGATKNIIDNIKV